MNGTPTNAVLQTRFPAPQMKVSKNAPQFQPFTSSGATIVLPCPDVFSMLHFLILEGVNAALC